MAGLETLLTEGVVPFDFVTVGLWGLSENLSVVLGTPPQPLPALYLPLQSELAKTTEGYRFLMRIAGSNVLELVRACGRSTVIIGPLLSSTPLTKALCTV